MHLIKALLAQINPYTGDIKRNIKKHLDFIEKARKEGASLVIFPELSLTGYFLKDSIYDLGVNINKEGPGIFGPLYEASKNVSIIAGFVERDDNFNFYNSSFCLSRGKVLHVHRKVYLPTYGMFEELRYFKPGSGFNVFDLSEGRSARARASILTCEDAWHLSSSYICVNKGANIIIINSASPARGIASILDKFSSINMWEELLSVIAFYYKSYVIYANRVGFEDGVGFSGGSCVFTPHGEMDSCAGYLNESSLKIEINLDLLNSERFKTPLIRDENLHLTFREIQDIIGSKK